MLYEICLKGSNGMLYSCANGYVARTPQEALKRVTNKITLLDNSTITAEVYGVDQLNMKNTDEVVKSWRMRNGKLERVW